MAGRRFDVADVADRAFERCARDPLEPGTRVVGGASREDEFRNGAGTPYAGFVAQCAGSVGHRFSGADAGFVARRCSGADQPLVRVQQAADVLARLERY